MKPGSTFQIITMIIFGFFAILAVLVFSGVFPIFNRGSNSASGEIVVWGTIPEEIVAPLFSYITDNNKNLKIVYEEKNAASFDNNFIEALASGNGPDLFFLPQNFILKYEDKIMPIPYSSISERDFKNTYIEEGELYLGANGILGLPIIIDPMVMYWNRNMFSSEGIPNPPSYWDELATIVPKLSKKDKTGNIIESAISFGEFKNVSYAKDILAMLMMQTGNTLILRDNSKIPKVTLLGESGRGVRSADTALNFFTEFSDPAKSVYSWNKSLSSGRDSFLGGRLAMYFSFASEIGSLRSKNPHLNFDVSEVPRPRGNKIEVNFGRVEAVAIVRASKNINSAFFVANEMAGANFAGALAKNLYLPPARRDLLSLRPQDSYLQFFYDNALVSRGWLDPNPVMTDQIFGDMVDNVVSGRYRVSEATSIASQELNKLIQR